MVLSSTLSCALCLLQETNLAWIRNETPTVASCCLQVRVQSSWLYIYIYRERERERENGRNQSMSALQNKLGANLLVEFRRLQLARVQKNACSTCSSWQKGIQSGKEKKDRRRKRKKKQQLAVLLLLLHISAAGRLVGAIAYNYRRCSLPTLSELNKFRVDSLFSHQYFTALKTLWCMYTKMGQSLVYLHSTF